MFEDITFIFLTVIAVAAGVWVLWLENRGTK